MFIPGPGEPGRPYAGSVTPDAYADSVVYNCDWPWLAHTTWEYTPTHDRELRHEHVGINSAIDGNPQVLEDLTNRYKTVTRVNAQAEEYVNNKYQLFDQLLQATMEVPKEFRVRCQTSPTFDMSKLSSMPMPSDTDTTTAIGTIGTTVGSSY